MTARNTSSPSDHDKQLLAEYSWNFYKILPAAMAISTETGLLKALYGEGMTLEKCADLLQDTAFRALFLRCWESGCFDDVRSSERFCSNPQQFEPETPQDYRGLASGSDPSDGEVVMITDSKFYDIGGDCYWHIHYSADRQEAVATWLSQIDQRVTHNAVSKKRAINTGTWFLKCEEFLDLYQDSSSRVLWCPGIPGVGKTVIASLAIDFLRKRQSNAFKGFIYFDHKLRSQQNLQMVLECLCRQLYETFDHNDIPMVLETMYNAHKRHQTRPSTEELQRSLRRAFEQVKRCFLVLDGLDEYLDNYSDAKIKELLEQLLSLGNHVQLIVMSRPLPPFKPLFEAIGSTQREVEVTDEDLTRYVKSELESRTFNFEVSSHLQEQIVEGIRRTAKGRFLIAALNMKHLAEKLNPGDLEDALKELPDQEDKAYSNVMERVEGYPDDRKHVARNAILLIAYTKRPLRVDELQHALAAKEGRYDVERYLTPLSTIMASCAGLLVIRGVNVVFVHFTAQEYFEKPQFREQHFPAADLFIARTCLDYLSLGILSDDTLADDYSHEISERLPFYDYAALLWSSHSILYGGVLESRIWEFLTRNHRATQHAARYIIYAVYANRSSSRDFEVSVSGAPLFVTVFHNQLSATCRLLESISELPRCSRGPTPLRFLSRPEQYDILRAFVTKFGPRIIDVGHDVLPDHRNLSALSHIISLDLEEAVKYMLAHPDIDPLQSNHLGRTSLHTAAIEGNPIIVEHLVTFVITAAAAQFTQETVAVSLEEIDEGGTYFPPFPGSDNKERPLTAKASPCDQGYSSSMLDVRDINGDTPLMLAVRCGHLAAARVFLKAGAKIDVQNSDGETTVFAAACTSDATMIEWLLVNGGAQSLNVRNHQGKTPLMAAASYYRPFKIGDAGFEEKCLACVSLLAQQPGIDINMIDNDGRTALYVAYRAGYIAKLVPLLEQHGAQLLPGNEAFSLDDFFLTAVSDGVEPVVKFLLNKGVAAAGLIGHSNGKSPLSLAVSSGNDQLVRLILSQTGVDVNAQDHNGATPMHSALRFLGVTRRETESVMHILNRRDVDMTKTDKRGQSYLHVLFDSNWIRRPSTSNPHITSIVKILLQRNPQMLYMQDIYGNTPLASGTHHFLTAAILNDLFDIPHVYENIDSLINSRNHAGETPLILACKSTYWDNRDLIERLLLENVLGINVRDHQGRTALSWAICNLQKNCLTDPHHDSADCKLVGYFHSRYNCKDRIVPEVRVKARLLVLLSRKDIDINLADNEGHTPLWYARRLGYDRVARMLLARGASDVGSELQ